MPIPLPVADSDSEYLVYWAYWPVELSKPVFYNSPPLYSTDTIRYEMIMDDNLSCAISVSLAGYQHPEG